MKLFKRIYEWGVIIVGSLIVISSIYFMIHVAVKGVQLRIKEDYELWCKYTTNPTHITQDEWLHLRNTHLLNNYAPNRRGE